MTAQPFHEQAAQHRKPRAPGPITASARSLRFLAVARLIGQTYGGYKSIQLMSKLIGAERTRWMYHRHNRASAKLAYRTATSLEGWLIKAGQFLGTRADISPQEYIEILSQLRDRVPPRLAAEIYIQA